MSNEQRSDEIYVLSKLGSILLGVVLGFSHVAISKGDWVGGFVIFGIAFYAIESTLALIYKKTMHLTMTSLSPTDNKYIRISYAVFINIVLIYVIYDIYSYGGFLGFTDAK